MTRIIFCSIFIIWLLNSVHCKHYLVEVADEQGGSTQDTAVAVPESEEAEDESQEEVGLEDIESIREENLESESKHLISINLYRKH